MSEYEIRNSTGNFKKFESKKKPECSDISNLIGDFNVNSIDPAYENDEKIKTSILKFLTFAITFI